MRIVIIGTGNAATVLARKMISEGHEITQVIGRNIQSASRLAGELNNSSAAVKEDLDRTGDLYVIATSDNAIAEVAGWLAVDKKLVVHTAGAVSKNVLHSASKNYGVLYPLQSLRKEIHSLPQIPFLVDGNTEDNLTLIYDFAKTLSENVQHADDEKRLKLHVVAVLVSNFTNHIYTLANEYCEKERLNFTTLIPLIKEIAARLENYFPSEMQTGPAIRNDLDTIQKHKELLTKYELQSDLYNYFTNSIAQWYSKPGD